MDKLLTNSGQSGQTLLLLKKGFQKQNGNVEKFMDKASYPHTKAVKKSIIKRI